MPRADVAGHVCDSQRRIDFAVHQLGGIDGFDRQLASFLETPRGRFEVWYAARRR